MKAAIAFVMMVLGTASADMAADCEMASFYLELGCTPVAQSDSESICPEAFTCPDLHPDPTKCYYRGMAFEDRTTIQQGLIKNPCSQACTCTVSPKPEFDCAAVDCVETFDTDMKAQCINTYELDSCCSVGTVCGKDDIAQLKTCEIDGQTYREGQTFEPLNTKKTCICTAKWTGDVNNTDYCRDINCGIEIHYQSDLMDKCAPIFVEDAKGCPIGFECPSAKTKLVKALSLRESNLQCQFNNMTLSMGDQVVVDDKCTKCTCTVPPLVTCTRQNSC